MNNFFNPITFIMLITLIELIYLVIMTRKK